MSFARLTRRATLFGVAALAAVPAAATVTSALAFPAGPLTLAQAEALDFAALVVQFAQLVAEDDGDDTTRDERQAALTMVSEAQDGLEAATEAAFPAVEWWTP